MNKETARYRRALKKQLHCSIKTRKKLLAQFEESLSPFLEDSPAPTCAKLEVAFGTPAEMAAILMETVPETEQIRYKNRKTLLRVLAGIAAALFVAFAMYVFFEKEFTVITSYSEVIPGNVASSQGGN